MTPWGLIGGPGWNLSAAEMRRDHPVHAPLRRRWNFQNPDMANFRPPRRALVALLGLLAAAAVPAQELSWSGFGTLGWARSDQGLRYQRFIDDQGSARRDSLLGAQADLRLGARWSATVQARIAPSDRSDDGWRLSPTWAFVGWRPGDDWLLRAGRLRIPLYMYSQTLDIGQTHDMARLPTELYTLTPANDFDGLYLTHAWTLGEGELTLDAYGGTAASSVRFWYRDGLPPALPAGASFLKTATRIRGLALTWRQPTLLARASLMTTRTDRRDGVGLPTVLPYVELAPGLGYYKVDDALPGPPMQRVDSVRNTLVSVGAEWQPAPRWRLAAEIVRNKQFDTPFGLDARAAYAAVFHEIGRFTPYVSRASISSSAETRAWQQRLLGQPLPAVVPGADMINALQRITAESAWIADQRSWALGTSYAVSPSLKLKAEWLTSRIGPASRLVDTPPGSDGVSDTTIHVWSFNLNFAW